MVEHSKLHQPGSCVNCRSCGTYIEKHFIDLGFQPPSNSFFTLEQTKEPQTYYPLQVYHCPSCHLVQAPDHNADLFTKSYPYFSGVSKSYCDHAKKYADMIIDRLKLNEESYVMEIASNDGYLLKNFLDKGIPCQGIEPCESVANEAIKKGVPTSVELFSSKLYTTRKADLVIANNVLAHVPELNDFVCGIRNFLGTNGVATFEFHHLIELLKHGQFDTIYHEHFSYLSLTACIPLFERHGLKIYDVERLSTHGGSLRIYVCHSDVPIGSTRIVELLEEEQTYFKDDYYFRKMQSTAIVLKGKFLDFLHKSQQWGESVVAFGAAAKGNTFLNYCGVKSDMIKYVIDETPWKQGKFLPGSCIPVISPDEMRLIPGYIVILPWNFKEEISAKLSHFTEHGTKLVTCIPDLEGV